MVIYLKDFKRIYNTVKRAYEIGSDTVYCEKYGLTKPDEMQFSMGDFDRALFYDSYPTDYFDFVGYDLKSLYKLLFLIKSGGMNIEKFIEIDMGNRTLINIDAAMESLETKDILISDSAAQRSAEKRKMTKFMYNKNSTFAKKSHSSGKLRR